MKNKKLFAILTLVCFMFTLMPVAAFAADPADYAVKVKDENGAWVEDVYVEAPATVTVAATNRLTTVAFYAVDAEGNAVQVKYAEDENKATFTFKTAGTYTIYGVVDNTKATNNGTSTELKDVVAAANSLTDELTVVAAVAKIETQLAEQIIKTGATVVVEAKEANYTIAVTPDTVTPKADSGFSTDGNKQVTVTLKNNGNAVVGKVPTITAPDYVTVVPANAKKTVTDVAGKITYNISANRAGNFEVVFSYEDAEDKTVKVNAYDNTIANVEVVKEATNPINKAPNASVFNTGATLKFTDANGSVIDVVSDINADNFDDRDMIKVSVVSQPATSKLVADDFALVDSATAGASDLVVETTKDLKVGTYEVKLALGNGKYVIVAFEAAKMGDAVGIRFVDPATTVALNAVSPAFTVEAYDANGVTETLTLVEKGINTFKVSNEDKYVGSTVTVLAKTADNKFVATTVLEVVDNGMEVVYTTTAAEVGVTTILNAKVVDAKGNKVTVPTCGEGYDMKVVVLEKPANAYVYANAEIGATAKDIAVTFLGSVAGEYKLQTIVVDDNNEYVTGIETITVGANANSFKDVVVMSIGANKIVVNSDVKVIDCAPVVENNRTFVPFRALIQAFGAEVAYDEATQKVTAELNGVTVVMTIGSAEYTVNGEVKTADVAPFIKDSRTMVPVRFVAEAFGINVTPVYGEDGATVDVLFAK